LLSFGVSFVFACVEIIFLPERLAAKWFLNAVLTGLRIRCQRLSDMKPRFCFQGRDIRVSITTAFRLREPAVASDRVFSTK